MKLSVFYYRIETLEKHGWDAGTVNEPNRFGSEEEAIAAVHALQALGGAWEGAKYRVVREPLADTTPVHVHDRGDA